MLDRVIFHVHIMEQVHPQMLRNALVRRLEHLLVCCGRLTYVRLKRLATQIRACRFLLKFENRILHFLDKLINLNIAAKGGGAVE